MSFSYCQLVFNCDKTQWPNWLGMQKFISANSSQVTVQKLRKLKAGAQDRKLEAGIVAETMEKHCLLACFQGLLSLISYTSQDHQSWSRTTLTHCWLPPASEIFTDKKNESDRGIFSVEVPLSQITLLFSRWQKLSINTVIFLLFTKKMNTHLFKKSA